MTCPRCARDLLATALDALARGDLLVVNQALREAITEWPHVGEADALRGELARLEKLGVSPRLDYWLGVATRRDEPVLYSATVSDQPMPCGHCPGGDLGRQ